MEWDRAAEDLTWDRLLGLDGSLLFLEHVFWVISLNSLFILVFAFMPYHLGSYFINTFNMHENVQKTHFDGLITTIFGYIVLSMNLITIYALLAFTSTLNRVRKAIGLCYIVIKVGVLVVFEICVFPLIVGLWIDICTIRLLNSTLNERRENFEKSPGTSVFIHWLVGMIYVFYFATFVFLLREVFRPGLLWFLRNLNDPDFNPIQEMIQLPVYRHIRRFLTTVTIFGFTIILIFLLPIKIIFSAQEYLNSSGVDLVKVLPYNVAQTSETLSTELSVELLWLHAALPALLEQSHIRIWTKNCLKLWSICVAWILDLKYYLFGDDKQKVNFFPKLLYI
jgi:E3 ubiquitin-protein ligase MARCH6